MRLERVLQMTVNEVVMRGRQEASKWLDRIAPVTAPVIAPERVGPGGRGVRGADGHHGAAPAFTDPLREGIALRFFTGAAHAGATARLVERIPEVRERIVSTADAICRGRFDLLGYRGLNFGDPVDWHLDPISARRAPLLHWSRLDPLDTAVVGDRKVVWELNRHQWLLYLGQAYRFTGDARYAEVFARYVQEWMRANPTGIGINWASSLEVSFRLISWCWALALFAGAPAVSAERLTEMVAGLGDHARHIERYLSLYSSPNTHLTGEALGLFYAGILFPDTPPARRWLARGADILVQQCERHILADGVYFEQSTSYQRYTAEIYLHFLILAARNGIDVPPTVPHRLQRLLDFLMAVRRPDGSMPPIGDADGGWLLPLTPRTPDDLRGVFSVAAAFFARSDYAWAAGSLAPERLWLVGPTGENVVETLRAAPPQAAPSRLFPEGGYAVMRTGWDRGAHHLVFDVGPLGCPVSAGHGHADLLSVQCTVFGEPYLVDPGTHSYASHPEWRNFFRSTAAHSTVRVDGQEQAVPAGPFKWQARPCARLRHWLSTEAFDFADAEHNAYDRLPNPVRHRRRVLFVKPRYWVMVDDLEGTGQHRVELCLQFAPLRVTVGKDLWIRAHGTTGSALLIRAFATVSLEATIRTGEADSLGGWVSPDYGQREPAPRLVYAADSRLPLRIVTLLFPTQDPQARPPAVSVPDQGEGGSFRLRFEDSDECVRFETDGPVVQRG